MIRCIAIDDEPLSLNLMERYIERIPELQLVGTAFTVTKAKELLEREKVDLIFLDIEMPGTNGMEFAKTLFERYESLSIVFTTAYPQYALEGFRVDAVDYLLKPLDINDMKTAVEKVKRRMALNTQTADDDNADNYIFIKSSGRTHKLRISDIIYIKGLSEYVQICVRGESKLFTTHESLKKLENNLSAERFMRIHKSFLINLNFLESADSESVTVNGIQLPIGQKYKVDFKQYLKGKFLHLH